MFFFVEHEVNDNATANKSRETIDNERKLTFNVQVVLKNIFAKPAFGPTTLSINSFRAKILF